MRKQKTLLIAFSLILAVSIAYAAVVGTLTIGGNGTLGEVATLEFRGVGGNHTVAAADLKGDVGVLPSQVTITEDLITISGIVFPDIDAGDGDDEDEEPGFTLDFLVYNSGGSPATLAAPNKSLVLTLANDVTVTYNGTNTVVSDFRYNEGGGIDLTDYFDFVGTWFLVSGDDIAVGEWLGVDDYEEPTEISSGTYAVSMENPLTFGLKLAEKAETGFGEATGLKVPGSPLSLAGATFTFTSELNYEAASA